MTDRDWFIIPRINGVWEKWNYLKIQEIAYDNLALGYNSNKKNYKEIEMTIINRSVTVNADAQKIWNIAVDPSRIPEWFEGIEEQIVGENWPAVGTTGTNVYSAAGIRLENTLRITEYDELHKIRFELGGMLSGTFTWTYTENNGQTTVNVNLDYELAGGALGKIANKLIFERTNESNIEKTLQNLKRIAES